ncbi:MAG: hypothetical protein RMZ69_20160 [Nostoc sp. ChiQUE01a]|nr:hypothetical protein [Nostoc sp. ChiQUE01a]
MQHILQQNSELKKNSGAKLETLRQGVRITFVGNSDLRLIENQSIKDLLGVLYHVRVKTYH